jgi:hypothetical protein
MPPRAYTAGRRRIARKTRPAGVAAGRGLRAALTLAASRARSASRSRSACLAFASWVVMVDMMFSFRSPPPRLAAVHTGDERAAAGWTTAGKYLRPASGAGGSSGVLCRVPEVRPAPPPALPQMERRTLPPEMPSALGQDGCPGSGEHAGRGSGCLNLMAALRPMPLARWQYLKIFGTGQLSSRGSWAWQLLTFRDATLRSEKVPVV